MKRAKVNTVKAQSQRLLSIVLSACLFSMVMVGGAYAYTGTPAAIFGSEMVTGGVDIAIPDEGETVYYVPGQKVKLSHPISNKGADSYVRVQFASNNAVEENGIQVVSANWKKFDDGYWYYEGTQEDNGILRASDENPLSVEYEVQFSDSYDAENAQVTLQAQAVQSANFQPDYENSNPWGDRKSGSGIEFGDPKNIEFSPATLDVTFENLTSENVVRGTTSPVVTRTVGGGQLQIAGGSGGSVSIMPGDRVDYQVMLGRDAAATGKLRVYLWAKTVSSDAIGSGEEAASEASFAEHTDLTVFNKATGKELYDGKVSDILNPETNGQAYLGEYGPGASEMLDFTMKVSELLGNEFENMKLNFALEISTDEESSDPEPAAPVDPDPDPTPDPDPDPTPDPDPDPDPASNTDPTSDPGTDPTPVTPADPDAPDTPDTPDTPDAPDTPGVPDDGPTPTTPDADSPTTPATTPTTPAATTTATAATTPAAAAPAATAPASPTITTISDADVPLASETIDDEGNPLGTTTGCWVHPWIVLGIVVTMVYSLVILIRRQRNSNKHQDFDDDVMGLNDEREREEQQAGAWRPAPQPAMSAALE